MPTATTSTPEAPTFTLSPHTPDHIVLKELERRRVEDAARKARHAAIRSSLPADFNPYNESEEARAKRWFLINNDRPAQPFDINDHSVTPSSMGTAGSCHVIHGLGFDLIQNHNGVVRVTIKCTNDVEEFWTVEAAKRGKKKWDAIASRDGDDLKIEYCDGFIERYKMEDVAAMYRRGQTHTRFDVETRKWELPLTVSNEEAEERERVAFVAMVLRNPELLDLMTPERIAAAKVLITTEDKERKERREAKAAELARVNAILARDRQDRLASVRH